MSKPEHIRIIKPGILSTIQDEGRRGYRDIGIGPGGVMDRYAFDSANQLLGNEPNSPVLEMHFPAPVIEFLTECICCITGGDFDARLNDKQIPPWTTFPAGMGDVLSFNNMRTGFRSYLAVSGGFESDKWLGSCSTHLTLGMGGYKGRPLKKEDILLIKKNPPSACTEAMNSIDEKDRLKIYDFNNPVLCIPGPEWSFLDDQSQKLMLSGSFRISENSNRMACLLESPVPVKLSERKEMLSSAVLMGTVQLQPDGNMAVLMADHQTTGGFPRILQIPESQFPKLAQSRPGERLTFEIVDLKTATENYLSFMKSCQHDL